jgi:hypothetical protein
MREQRRQPSAEAQERVLGTIRPGIGEKLAPARVIDIGED